jgi:hypothetical protein
MNPKTQPIDVKPTPLDYCIIGVLSVWRECDLEAVCHNLSNLEPKIVEATLHRLNSMGLLEVRSGGKYRLKRLD